MQKNIFFIRAVIVFSWLIGIALLLYTPAYLPKTFSKKSINILIWPGIFEPQVIDDFEKSTGIKVNISFFESNEELLSKVRVTQGAGYDLLLPSDYAIHALVRDNILKPLDKKQLNFWSRLNPMLLDHYYDPGNIYSVPISWDISGIAYNKQLINIDEPSWKYIFDTELLRQHKIVMTNDALEAVLIAAIYLFGSPARIGLKKMDVIKQLLHQQNQLIEAYTEYRPDYYLITKNASTAYLASIYLWRSIRDYPELDFIIPQEGSLLSIESFVIPKNSQKDQLVYSFINYMLSKDIETRNFVAYALLPVALSTHDIDVLDIHPRLKKFMQLTRHDIQKFYFPRYEYFEKPIDEQFIRDVWIRIKA